MTKLDYELKCPMPRRPGPSTAHIVTWIASCSAAAFVGLASGWYVAFGALPAGEVVCVCWLLTTGMVAVLPVPLLVFLEDAPVWMKISVGAIAAFAMTFTLIVVLAVVRGG